MSPGKRLVTMTMDGAGGVEEKKCKHGNLPLGTTIPWATIWHHLVGLALHCLLELALGFVCISGQEGVTLTHRLKALGVGGTSKAPVVGDTPTHTNLPKNPHRACAAAVTGKNVLWAPLNLVEGAPAGRKGGCGPARSEWWWRSMNLNQLL